MRKTLLPLAAAGVLLAVYATAAQTPPAPAVEAAAAGPAKRPRLEAIPEELFARELKDLDGQALFLSNFRGQLLVLNLWATWCGPCRSEVPVLNRLHDEFSPRGVGFLGLTVEDPEVDAGTVLFFVEQYKIGYTVGWADRETALTLLEGRNSVPQTLLIGPNGRILKRFIGFSRDRSPAAIRDAVRRALDDIE